MYLLTYFWLIHPNFDTFRDIPRYTVNSIIRLHSARIFRIADIIVDCDLLQIQQRLLLLYLWETTDAWSLRQLQLASAFGVRLPSVSRVDWSDSWLSTYQMSGGRRLLSEIERSPHSQSVELKTGCIEPNSAFKHYIISPVLFIHQ